MQLFIEGLPRVLTESDVEETRFERTLEGVLDTYKDIWRQGLFLVPLLEASVSLHCRADSMPSMCACIVLHVFALEVSLQVSVVGNNDSNINSKQPLTIL